MIDHKTYAAELFNQGYNCSQSVMVAFSDVTGLSKDYAARLASPYGGGMGRMREVCGAVSGMLMVTGLLYGYSDPKDMQSKRELYTLEQELAGKFKAVTGSIVCRELLKNPSSDPNPSPRTEEYYRLRPCARMVYLASEILDDYIRENPPTAHE